MRILVRRRQPRQRYECFDCHEEWKNIPHRFAGLYCPACGSENVEAMS